MVRDARGRVEDGAKTTDKKTLLVVDDDVEWTDLLKIFFAHKYAVCVANHAEQAIEIIIHEAPQVILLDLIMPSVDGFGLMHRMREMSLNEAPTILTTGWGSVDLKESAEAVGCVAVLLKPISLPELDALVAKFMDGLMEGAHGLVA